jgi:transposase-like protein
VDASYFKVRSGGQYLNKALFVATGVREDGYREILGAKIADVEDEGFWSVFLEELKERGLRGVLLVISDGHKGIQKAVQESFLGASWQISLTEVSESFDEVETCATYISSVLY